VSGIIVGVLAVGLPSRIAMRVLAVTSGDKVQGAFSDDAEEIGEITLMGSIIVIVVVGAIVGVLGGSLYALLRPLLPAVHRALASGVIAAGIGAAFLVKPDGRDFAILHPLWLAVALFVAIPFLFGLLLPIVDERLRGFYERAPMRLPHLLAFTPMLILVPAFFVLVPGLVIGIAYAVIRPGTAPAGLMRMGRYCLLAGTILILLFGVSRIADVEGRDPAPSDFIEPVFG